MSRDLFGREIDPVYSQEELSCAQFLVVGRTCPECKKALIDTPSGWKSCPLGHGFLKVPDGAVQLKMGVVPIPVWMPLILPSKQFRR